MSDHFKRFGKKDLMFPQTQPPLSISLPPPLCLSLTCIYLHARTQSWTRFTFYTDSPGPSKISFIRRFVHSISDFRIILLKFVISAGHLLKAVNFLPTGISRKESSSVHRVSHNTWQSSSAGTLSKPAKYHY